MTVPRTKTRNLRQRRRDDELGAEHAGHESHDRLRQPADADDSAGQGVLHETGRCPQEQPGDRAGDEPEVDHDDQHEIEGGGPPDHEAGERRLESQRGGDGRQGGDDFHSRGLAVGSAASAAFAGSGVRITSTSSSREKSTAGRTLIS